MARPGVTSEQVLQTIQQLESEGAEVTVTAVRDRLGTGSFTTISQILQSWREDRARVSRSPVPEVPDQVASLFRQLWMEAWRAADAVAASERETAAQERVAAETQAQEMKGEIARLERALAALQAETDQLAAAHAATNQELQAARIEHAQAAASAALLQEETAQLRASHREIIEAGQKVSAELATWIERATRAETRLDDMQKRPSSKASRT